MGRNKELVEDMPITTELFGDNLKKDLKEACTSDRLFGSKNFRGK